MAEYFDYNNIFSAENVAELPENIGMNEHAIKQEKNKQLYFGLIYNLGLLEVEMLKTHIETNLAKGFIRLSKSLVGIFILFDRKPNRSFHLSVDYWGFNNIIIKN